MATTHSHMVKVFESLPGVILNIERCIHSILLQTPVTMSMNTLCICSAEKSRNSVLYIKPQSAYRLEATSPNIQAQ